MSSVLERHVRNRLIFPAITSMIICLLYDTDNWIYRLFLAGIFLWFSLKEGRFIAYFCIVGSIMVSVSYKLQEYSFLEEKETAAQVTLSTDTIRANGSFLTMEGRLSESKQKVQLSYQVNTEEELKTWLGFRGKGIELTAEGEFISPEKKRNPYTFDQEAYFRNHRISGRFQIQRVEKITIQNHWRNWLQRKRGAFISFVQSEFPQKTSVYINSLLWGYKDSGFRESEEIFRESGLLHLFSLSGLHIQFYLGWLYYLFRRIGWPLHVSIIPLSLLTICYVSLAGSSISVLRASLLFLLRLLVKLLNKRYSSMDLFAVVFWLLFTLLVAPVFKFLFLPSVFFLTLFNRWLPRTLLLLIEEGLILFERMIDSFSGSTLVIGRLPLVLSGVYIFGLLICMDRLNEQPMKLLFYVGLFSLMLLTLPFLRFSSTIAFIDVGQGDSIFLQSPFRKETILIDTGGKLHFEREKWAQGIARPPAERNIVPYLKGQGISVIDKLILTHDDTDHVGELSTLSQHFTIKKIYIGWGAGRNEPLRRHLTEAQKNGTKIIEVKHGDRIKGYYDLYVLTPFEKGEGRNEDSIGLWTEYNNSRFLFLGDLNQAMEEQLLSIYPNLKADVVKLGHHGSRTSSNTDFLSRIEAKHGIISCGVNNRYGHPHSEVLEALEENQIRTWRTDQQGMITYRWHPVFHPHGLVETMID
ncbi:TPA: ComEC/Rec2 family competence protein [Enterococcus faecium]|nr:ComEC/Rec2 family competence protein [Enterococcus faecium]